MPRVTRNWHPSTPCHTLKTSDLRWGIFSPRQHYSMRIPFAKTKVAHPLLKRLIQTSIRTNRPLAIRALTFRKLAPRTRSWLHQMKFLSDHRRILSLLAHQMIIRCGLRSQAIQWLSSCRIGQHLDIPQLLLHTQRMGIEFSALAQLPLIQWRRRVPILQHLLHTHLVDILCSL